MDSAARRWLTAGTEVPPVRFAVAESVVVAGVGLLLIAGGLVLIRHREALEEWQARMHREYAWFVAAPGFPTAFGVLVAVIGIGWVVAGVVTVL